MTCFHGVVVKLLQKVFRVLKLAKNYQVKVEIADSKRNCHKYLKPGFNLQTAAKRIMPFRNQIRKPNLTFDTPVLFPAFSLSNYLSIAENYDI